jgi:cytochrome c
MEQAFPPLTLAAVMFVAGVAHAQVQDVPSLLQKYGCSSCHADDERITGPAFLDVAIKYRGNPKAPAILAAVVRKGVHGGGPWPMPPSPQVTDGDAARIVQYILALRS